MVGLASAALATFRATISDVFSRCLSISNKLIVDSPSSGKLKISFSRLRANTVLPAPMKAIFAMMVSSLRLANVGGPIGDWGLGIRIAIRLAVPNPQSLIPNFELWKPLLLRRQQLGDHVVNLRQCAD